MFQWEGPGIRLKKCGNVHQPIQNLAQSAARNSIADEQMTSPVALDSTLVTRGSWCSKIAISLQQLVAPRNTAGITTQEVQISGPHKRWIQVGITFWKQKHAGLRIKNWILTVQLIDRIRWSWCCVDLAIGDIVVRLFCILRQKHCPTHGDILNVEFSECNIFPIFWAKSSNRV